MDWRWVPPQRTDARLYTGPFWGLTSGSTLATVKDSKKKAGLTKMDWREAPEKFYYNMTKVNKKYTVNIFVCEKIKQA